MAGEATLAANPWKEATMPCWRIVACVIAACIVPSFDASAADERESFELRVPLAPPPVVVEGRAHLFHELHLTNFSRQALVLETVAAVDAAGGKSVAAWSGDALAQRRAPAVPSAGEQRGIVAPGARDVVYIELAFAPGAVPASLRYRVDYRAQDDASRTWRVESAVVDVDPRPAAMLGPPLRGGPWAAVFDPGWERGHRRVFYAIGGRATLPGRFAIDFVKLDAAGRIAAGDPDVIANAHGHGEDVLAVADAQVVAVRNDYPEAERVSANGRHPLSDGSGNYVMLDLGDARYAIYEHLRPGSVRVAPGQRVRRGEVVGEVGLSGSGGWPHLHFHVADAPSLLDAEGLPFAIERFRSLGAYADFDDLGKRAWTPRTGGDGERTHERPAGNGVVMFPE